ncbi:hypothetical protein L7F22_055637 [Adiantum nelumboides]|nr:hypothetical protein [Adiantum nelumboides]
MANMAFSSFHGRSDEDATDFMDNLKVACVVFGRDDDVSRLQIFLLLLKAEAKNWFNTLLSAIRVNWGGLRMAFMQRFGARETFEQLWERLCELSLDAKGKAKVEEEEASLPKGKGKGKEKKQEEVDAMPIKRARQEETTDNEANTRRKTKESAKSSKKKKTKPCQKLTIKDFSLGIKHLNAFEDALLLVKQVHGTWACRNKGLVMQLRRVKELLKSFEVTHLLHVPRKDNQEANALANEQLQDVTIGIVVL